MPTVRITNGNTSVRTTADNGGQGVLEMGFFIYDFLNVPYLKDAVGMVSMLHDNEQIPQIEIDGIGFAPNRKHTSQFSKETTSFLSAPYTNCTEIILADMKTMLGAYYSGTQYQYSRQVCLNLCEQTYI
ncbi:unnamed protein product [Didymodactylos carnosus]|uniref:Uncharacterized protein n=1 Tax=Didymodactylos carnosus TaxID=1234261 RepID=A0A815U3Z0_9BILA|nr:unnamed protein product [Didymodactylos carnosus]CAF1514358.1 unnamed protein product [Didymodactylos carnosus]CAF4289624.1 unnamed protein product [Didymodactylos carnosus]CAF4374561.1 unnamed protein product [Didymodactylos carnosus]